MATINSFQETILIIDDNPTNLAVLFHSLEAAGLHIYISTNGEAALRIVSKIMPDLILLDVMMPGLDGFETCRRLKLLPAVQDIPVIFMTALADTEDELTGFQVGGVDYITKPIQVETVLARVNTHLMLRHLHEQLEQQNERLAEEINLRRSAEYQLKTINKTLENLANLDGLTQVANRRRFDHYLEQLWVESNRLQHPLTLILVDVDYFKQYNDTYGHLAGDECLQQLACLLNEAVASVPRALVARYGGEEFALILPEYTLQQGVFIAETIQQTLVQHHIPHANSAVSSSLTLSLGIATIIPTSLSTINDFVSLVDQALYQAKAQGRNQYTSHDATSLIREPM